jgi:hypothetical protein
MGKYNKISLRLETKLVLSQSISDLARRAVSQTSWNDNVVVHNVEVLALFGCLIIDQDSKVEEVAVTHSSLNPMIIVLC